MPGCTPAHRRAGGHAGVLACPHTRAWLCALLIASFHATLIMPPCLHDHASVLACWRVGVRGCLCACGLACVSFPAAARLLAHALACLRSCASALESLGARLLASSLPRWLASSKTCWRADLLTALCGSGLFCLPAAFAAPRRLIAGCLQAELVWPTLAPPVLDMLLFPAQVRMAHRICET